MPELDVKLTVNNNPIELSGFPKEFLLKTTIGAVSSLKKVGDIKNLEMSLSAGKVTIAVNGEKIPLSPFPNNIIVSTMGGLLATLKGVEKKVESFKIEIK